MTQNLAIAPSGPPIALIGKRNNYNRRMVSRLLDNISQHLNISTPQHNNITDNITMDITVVVPSFNEEESLPELYAWIERVMKGK